MEWETWASSVLEKKIDSRIRCELFRMAMGIPEPSQKNERWLLGRYVEKYSTASKASRLVIVDQFTSQVTLDALIGNPADTQSIIALIENSIELHGTPKCILVDFAIEFHRRRFLEWAASKNICIQHSRARTMNGRHLPSLKSKKSNSG
jgi:hypothetical protein